MAYWILKTDPETYSWPDLERDGQTVWDGVRNAQALQHLRAMHRGDEVLIYHSGDQRAIVGLAHLASDPYPDPEAADPRVVVVDVVATRSVPVQLTLAAIRSDPAFAQLWLVRQGRLSVVPVSTEQWHRLSELCGLS